MCTEKIIFMAGNTHEYVAKEGNCDLFCCRALHGARGLKQPDLLGVCQRAHGRALHGARGLKHNSDELGSIPAMVAPCMGRVD